MSELYSSHLKASRNSSYLSPSIPAVRCVLCAGMRRRNTNITVAKISRK